MNRRELLTSGVSALAVFAAGCAESGGNGADRETTDAGTEATESTTTSASGTTANAAASEGSETTAANESPTTATTVTDAAFEVVASYPVETSDGTDYRRETVFTPDDFVEVGSVEGGDGDQQPFVPVVPSEAAAQRFVDVLTENGFTGEGVASCRWRENPDDSGWCLLTMLDGEVTYAASLAPGLADAVESGDYLDDPSFVVQASDAAEAERLRDAIRNETS